MQVPVIDIFAGAGGLSEGFSVWPSRAKPFFRIALSAEKAPAAVRTLRLRAFFRQYKPAEVPDAYYRFLGGEPAEGELRKILDGEVVPPPDPDQPDHSEVICPVAIGEPGFDSAGFHRLVDAARAGSGHWVLIGGPPCQPFSTAGRTRRRAIPGFDPETDHRNYLYKEYLRIIVRHWPAVFVMENVKGIISARLGGEPVLGQVLEDLSNPARLEDCRPEVMPERYRYKIWPLVTTEQPPDLWGVCPPGHYVIESEKYGIPQKRHRVILLGIRDDIQVTPEKLRPAGGPWLTCGEILAGLPPLRSGIARTPDSRQQWADIAAGPAPAGGWRGAELTDVADTPAQWTAVLRSAPAQPWFAELGTRGQADVREHILKVLAELRAPAADRGGESIPGGQPPRTLREWYEDPRLTGVSLHSTREHMPHDLHRYLYAAAFAHVNDRSPRLGDFPEGLRPLHKNVGKSLKHDNFADRFRVQVMDQPATTVMSHLAKDGHYFIHPDPAQARSLTVREAARLQTFPDNYFFCGNRTEQYTQVGNAVPPLLAWQIAAVVADVLVRAGISN